MNKTCPKCGEKMTLNVITNTWDCENCGNQVNDDEQEIVDTEEELDITDDKDIDNSDDKEINNDIDNNLNNQFNLYHCDNCNVSFVGENVDKCFICGGELTSSKTSISYSKYIDFKLDLGDAIHNYKRKLTFKLLCPFSFRRKNTLNRIKGVFIPMSLFDTSLDGDVIFNASDINVLDSSKKNKKMQYYKVVCNGHFDYNDVLINMSSKYGNNLLEKIDDFDYNELKEINELSLGEKVIYKEDCDEYSIFDRLKNRCVNNSVKLMSDLVNHTKKKVVENKLDFKYDKKGVVLVPVYVLTNKYKDKEYYYIMNGQNGNTYIKTPIGIIETVIFSILLFAILFAIMMLIAMFI